VRYLTGGIYQAGSHFGPPNIDAYDHGFNGIIPLDPKIVGTSPSPLAKPGEKSFIR
jgi:hypothetical protein